MTFPSLVNVYEAEAEAISKVVGVKEGGKVVVFSYHGKAHDGHDSVSNEVTEFVAAVDATPAKVTLGTLPAPAGKKDEAAPVENSWAWKLLGFSTNYITLSTL